MIIGLVLVPKAQPEISQKRSVWKTAHNTLRPERTPGAESEARRTSSI